jgi:hypothetical protein
VCEQILHGGLHNQIGLTSDTAVKQFLLDDEQRKRLTGEGGGLDSPRWEIELARLRLHLISTSSQEPGYLLGRHAAP